MKYLQFNEEGVLVLVSKTKVSEDDLEVEDSYNFQKEIEVDFKGESIKVSIDKTKDEVLEELFPKLSEEELAKYKLQNKIQEAKSYLNLTDWVKDYKLRHDLGLELIPETSSKWVVITKREEYLLFLKGL